MAKPIFDREYFGLPAPADFTSPGVLGSVLSRFLAGEKAVDEYCRDFARAGLAARYQHATDLRNDPVAFEAWKREPFVLGLARPPKNKESICRALLQATYLNPSTASKRWKRIEPLWKKHEPVSKVIALLEKHGLQPQTKPKPKPGDIKLDPEHDLDTTDDDKSGDAPANLDDCSMPNVVRLLNLPEDFISRKLVGHFVIVGGFIDAKDGNCVTLRRFTGG